MLPHAHFSPNETTAEQLLKAVSGATDDGSHDLSHILRVWQNVQHIAAKEGGDQAILTAATILHDCVDIPKNSPQRSSASLLSARKAAKILRGLVWDETDIGRVAHAIEAHSFSANVKPLTLEAKILQDADRLDATGHIGIARCFYVSGRMGCAIYDPADPTACNRPLDDHEFAIDHFFTKLLRLSGSFQTETGRKLGAERHKTMKGFVDGLLAEISSNRVSD